MIRHGEYLECARLRSIGWVRHCFTTRSFMKDGAARLEACRELKRKYFPSARAVVCGEQVHGAGIATVVGVSGDGFVEMPGIDSLICRAPGICLVAFGADCPIVYIADTKKKVIALVHSGRKGSEKHVVTACVERMMWEFGTESKDCVVTVGPSIGPCCYPVDIWSGIEEELRTLGITDVSNPGLCTACHPGLFFSYRREKGRCGRMLAGIMIEKSQVAKQTEARIQEPEYRMLSAGSRTLSSGF